MRVIPVTAVQQRGFGETYRRDTWWTTPLFVFIVLGSFVAYATWAEFQNAHYTNGPYLSPFYSPEIFGDSPHAWFGPKPEVWPSLLPFSPALLILPFPGLFRFTCDYYRGAYYKGFWADQPNCAVGEPRKSYWGEQFLPLLLHNAHRYFMYFALLFLVFLTYDVWLAMRWDDGSGGKEFGIGLGTLLLAVNVVLLASYTLGCHSLRHIIGGRKDELSKSSLKGCYNCVSGLNRRHQQFAWASLFSVMGSDLYVRLCSMGILSDWRIL